MEESEFVSSVRGSEEIDEICRGLKLTPNDTTLIMQLLNLLVLSKTSRPDLVVLYGPRLLEKSGSDLKYWGCVEQIYLAALEMSSFTLAKKAYEKLHQQFPDSRRVMRMKGMMLEAQGNYEEALRFYDDMLRSDETDVLTHKRRYCVLRARDGLDGAINALNTYLKTFMADTNAWQELADLHMTANRMSEAAYCYEELLLAAPQNYHFMNKYAEILYTSGELSNVRLARQYYIQSYELHSQGNTKALYGMLMCSQTLISSPDCGSEERQKSDTIATFAQKSLLSLYKGVSSPLEPTLKRMFAS